jgi:AI-2 transport protein TqsA
MAKSNQLSKGVQALFIIAAFVVVVAGMSAAKSIINPILLAAFISIISLPPLMWLKERKVPLGVSLLIVMFVVLVFLFLVASLVASSVTTFSAKLTLYAAKFKVQTDAALGWLEQNHVDVDSLKLDKVLNAAAVMQLVGMFLDQLVGMLTNGVLILLTFIFMILEAAILPDKLDTIFRKSKASLKRKRERVKFFMSTVNRYIALQTVISLATGVCVAIFLTIMGVDFALLWGVIAFLLNYIPNIGSIIAAVPAVLLTIIQFGLGRAGEVVAGYLVINMILGNVVSPRLMGRGLGLSTLVVFLSLIFWGWILGPVGMLLSVPLTMTVKIALDSSENTRWAAILLGSETTDLPKPAPAKKSRKKRRRR